MFLKIEPKFDRRVCRVFTVDFGQSCFEVNVMLYFGYKRLQFIKLVQNEFTVECLFKCKVKKIATSLLFTQNYLKGSCIMIIVFSYTCVICIYRSCIYKIQLDILFFVYFIWRL